MKQLYALFILICLLMTMTCNTSEPVTGTVDDVNTGTLFGTLLVDDAPAADTVTVLLYGDKNTGSLSKTVVQDKLLRTVVSGDGTYRFDSLPAGTYRIEVTEDSILVGEKEGIVLENNAKKEVNISITVIINQTFNIWTEENTTIENISIENGRIVKTDSGYILIFAEADTVPFTIEIERNDSTTVIEARTVKNSDKTLTFEVVADSTAVIIASENSDSTLFIPRFSLDAEATTINDGDSGVVSSVTIVLHDDNEYLATRFRHRYDSMYWSEWQGIGEDEYTVKLDSITAGLHTVSFQAACLGGDDTLTGQFTFFKVTPVSITSRTDSLVKKYVGETCTLSVTADGTAEKQFKWYKNGTAIEAPDSGALVLKNLTSEDAGTYYCKVTGRWNEVTAKPVVLTVENRYNVTYDGNGKTGGTVPVDENLYSQGSRVTVLGNNGSLVKEGYTFSTWNSTADGTGNIQAPGSVITIANSSCVLYAQWNPDLFTVTFDSRSGSAVSAQSVRYGELAASPQAPVRTDYTFTGWYKDSATTLPWVFTRDKITGGTTLYAGWTTAATYTLTYNGNGSGSGTVPAAPVQYLSTGVVTVLGNSGTLAKSGYVFSGWNMAAAGNAATFSEGDTFTMGAQNRTLYALWLVASIAQVTVTFNSRGGTAVGQQQVPVGAHLSEPTPPTRTDYTFTGWFTDSVLTHRWVFTSDTVAASLTLYAGWSNQPTYTVTYNGNNAGSGSVPVDNNRYLSGSQVLIIGNTGTLERSGFIFLGWNSNADGSGDNYAPGALIAMGPADLVLYVKWGRTGEYSVTYYGNGNTGGNPPGMTTHETGHTVTVLGNTNGLVKEGYTFVKWNTKANGTGTSYTIGSTFAMGTADVSLYAVWQVRQYTLTFRGNGNTTGTPPADSTRDYKTTVTLPGSNGMTRDGYHFTGWVEWAGAQRQYAVGAQYTFPSYDDTLLADWEPNDYTVTIDEQNGTSTVDTIIKYGSGITPAAPVRTGYTFGGWFTDAVGTARWNDGVVKSDTTLYAKWERIQYTVRFNTTIVSGWLDDTLVDSGTVAVVPADVPTATQYEIVGWCYDAVMTQLWDFSTPVIRDTVLYAKWAPKTFTVTFDAQGGTPVPSPQEVVYQGTVVKPAKPVKNGFDFAGWYTESSGGFRWDFTTKITAPDTIYAHWSAVISCNSFTDPGIGASNAKLPNPYKMLDNSDVTTADDWHCRRKEIKALAETYLYGHMPPKPSSVTSSISANRVTIKCKQGSDSIEFYYTITGTGSALLIDCMAGISAPANCRRIELSNAGTIRGYIKKLFPSSDAGQCMAAAWAVDLVIDAFEDNPGFGVDPEKIAVTGCSSSGRMALVIGAFCDRIALTIPIASSAGGTSNWRVAETVTNALGITDMISDSAQFGGQVKTFIDGVQPVDKLPVDQHMVAMLCAPRGLIILNNATDLSLLCAQCNVVTAKTARTVWVALGAAANIGYYQYDDPAIFLCSSIPSEAMTAVTSFVNAFLFGSGTPSGVMHFPAADDFTWTTWADWTEPSSLP